MKVFITGIGGCVGHYLFDILINDPQYELFLLVRNPSRLRFNPKAYPNVTVIKGDLSQIKDFATTVQAADLVIHLAAEWGAHEGNLDYALDLFKLLDPAKCQKVICFSTASILGPENRPLPAVEKLGTHYIRGKYLFYKKLPELPIYPKVTTLFPTWVLGGDSTHPYSHATSGIINLKNWLWLLRFLTVDVRFHFIHARDIALITKYLLEHDTVEKNLVLGNDQITAGQLIKEVATFYGHSVYFQVPIPNWLINLTIFLAGRHLHTWDKYCLAKRHFVYQTTNCETFGLGHDLKTLPQILKTF